MNKKRIKWLATDFIHPKTFKLNQDGLKSIEWLSRHFRGSYNKRQLSCLAFKLLKQEVEKNEITSRDEIETNLFNNKN